MECKHNMHRAYDVASEEDDAIIGVLRTMNDKSWLRGYVGRHEMQAYRHTWQAEARKRNLTYLV